MHNVGGRGGCGQEKHQWGRCQFHANCLLCLLTQVRITYVSGPSSLCIGPQNLKMQNHRMDGQGTDVFPSRRWEGKGHAHWTTVVWPPSNAKGIKKGSWPTLPQPQNSAGTELEMDIVTAFPVYFRPNELTFAQRKQGVNPISELSKDWCWIHYRQISSLNTVHRIGFCGIPILSKCWFRKWFKIKPEFVVQWWINGNELT